MRRLFRPGGAEPATWPAAPQDTDPLVPGHFSVLDLLPVLLVALHGLPLVFLGSCGLRWLVVTAALIFLVSVLNSWMAYHAFRM